jgi:hypothetical protein
MPPTKQGIASFTFLAAGLAGLLFFSTLKSRARYYLTNFRVLVLKRPVVGKNPKWSAMHYRQIKRFVEKKSFFFRRLTIEGDGESIDVAGLNPYALSGVEAILEEKLAARQSSKC